MSQRQHPYCYPGTSVLKNKLDIRNGDDLDAAERLVSASRMGTLRYDYPVTPAGYRRIHRHLFELLYDWAGNYRTVTTGRGPAPFCKAEFIEQQVERRFAAIDAAKDLHSLTADAFASWAAEQMNEINAIHPFLDGNGRAQRALLVTLGRKAGHAVDLGLIEPDAWNHASVAGFYAVNHGPMAKVIADAVIRLR